MRPFRFPFESLLKYRRHRRDLCRLVLARVLEDDAKLLRERQALEQTRHGVLAEMRAGSHAGAIDVQRIAAWRFHAGRLQAQTVGRSDRGQKGVAEIVPALMMHDHPAILMDHEVVAQR